VTLGLFVLRCINERWPRESCEREVLNLYASTDEERVELRQYVADMYEVFEERLKEKENESQRVR
jgi:hypothetical protein